MSQSMRAADFMTLEEAAYRIWLRENPDKLEWRSALDKMNNVRASLISATEPFDVFLDVKAVADHAQKRLKRDWNKVRNGEIGCKVLCFLFPSLFSALVVITI